MAVRPSPVHIRARAKSSIGPSPIFPNGMQTKTNVITEPSRRRSDLVGSKRSKESDMGIHDRSTVVGANIGGVIEGTPVAWETRWQVLAGGET